MDSDCGTSDGLHQQHDIFVIEHVPRSREKHPCSDVKWESEPIETAESRTCKAFYYDTGGAAACNALLDRLRQSCPCDQLQASPGFCDTFGSCCTSPALQLCRSAAASSPDRRRHGAAEAAGHLCDDL